MQQNGLDPGTTEIQNLQNGIQQLEYKVKDMAMVSRLTPTVPVLLDQ